MGQTSVIAPYVQLMSSHNLNTFRASDINRSQQDCFGNYAFSADDQCNDFDLSCLCDDQSFKDAMDICVLGHCSSDYNSTVDFADAYCASMPTSGKLSGRI